MDIWTFQYMFDNGVLWSYPHKKDGLSMKNKKIEFKLININNTLIFEIHISIFKR